MIMNKGYVCMLMIKIISLYDDEGKIISLIINELISLYDNNRISLYDNNGTSLILNER